jgi:hypothetical protein
MRRALPLIINVVALLTAEPLTHAAPIIVGRVGLVAAGQLSGDALAAGQRDGRALVTIRVAGGAATLRHAGFDARPLVGDIADLRATADELRRLAA